MGGRGLWKCLCMACGRVAGVEGRGAAHLVLELFLAQVGRLLVHSRGWLCGRASLHLVGHVGLGEGHGGDQLRVMMFLPISIGNVFDIHV